MNRFIFKQASHDIMRGSLIAPKDRQSMSKWLRAAIKASQTSHSFKTPIDDRYQIKDTIIGSSTIILRLEVALPTRPPQTIEAALIIERTSSMGR